MYDKKRVVLLYNPKYISIFELWLKEKKFRCWLCFYMIRNKTYNLIEYIEEEDIKRKLKDGKIGFFKRDN